jgi:hypothetical protein
MDTPNRPARAFFGHDRAANKRKWGEQITDIFAKNKEKVREPCDSRTFLAKKRNFDKNP